MNCWEFKKCGREPGGKNAVELGVCPACLEMRLNGVHRGLNAGRACWIVAGSMCQGVVQGTFSQRLGNCIKCDFYMYVRKEEDMKFEPSVNLLQRLNPGREHREK